MEEPTPEFRPYEGQVDQQFLTLDQVKALASPMRAMVFWTMRWNLPKSATDVAEEIGKSAATVRYHIASLAEVGLILAVDTRKKRSRTEALYVLRALSNMYRTGAEAGELYGRYTVRGLKLNTMKLIRETAHAFGLREHDESVSRFIFHRRQHLRLDSAAAEQLKKDMVAALATARASQVEREEGGVDVHISSFMAPTTFQTKLWAAELNLSLEELNRDGIPAEDESEDS